MTLISKSMLEVDGVTTWSGIGAATGGASGEIVEVVSVPRSTAPPDVNRYKCQGLAPDAGSSGTSKRGSSDTPSNVALRDVAVAESGAATMSSAAPCRRPQLTIIARFLRVGDQVCI